LPPSANLAPAEGLSRGSNRYLLILTGLSSTIGELVHAEEAITRQQNNDDGSAAVGFSSLAAAAAAAAAAATIIIAIAHARFSINWWRHYYIYIYSNRRSTLAVLIAEQCCEWSAQRWQ
jgi:cell division protein FtsW (lipid II flippase)